MREFAYVPVVIMLAAVVALTTPRDRLPPALRGVFRILRRDRAPGSGTEPKVRPVAGWRRLVAFVLTVLAFAVCLLVRA